MLLQRKSLFVQIGLFEFFALRYLVFGIFEIYYLIKSLYGLIVFFSFFMGDGPFVYVFPSQIDAFCGLLSCIFIAGNVRKSLFSFAILLIVFIFDSYIVKPSQSGFLVTAIDVFVYRINLFSLFFVSKIIGFLEIGVFLKCIWLILQIIYRRQFQFDDEIKQIGLRISWVVVQHSLKEAVRLLVVGIPDKDFRSFKKRANIHIGLNNFRFRFWGSNVFTHDLINATDQILHKAKFRQILSLE